MSEQRNDGAPDTGDQTGGPGQSSNKKRGLSSGVAGGAIMFAVLYVIDKLRPGRRRKGDESEPTGQIPASETPAAGTVETIVGPRPAPPGVHETISSPWPVVVAGAVAFTAFGLITNYALSIFGVVIMVVGIVGWVGELIRE